MTQTVFVCMGGGISAVVQWQWDPSKGKIEENTEIKRENIKHRGRKWSCRSLWSPPRPARVSDYHLNNLVRSKLLSIASLPSNWPGGMLANWMTLSYTVPYEHVPNAIIPAKAAGYISSAVWQLVFTCTQLFSVEELLVGKLFWLCDLWTVNFL